ncbi:MAG: GTPase ObgE [SAR324 cluster bacterium]|nr:GTPase ObgE [SAR324 cluster bacterium]
MKFIDSVKISIASGKGGDGCVAWRREKYVAFGGPAGGNGGRGGHIIIQGNSGLYTLYDFKLNPHNKAEKGKNGSGKDKHGKNGADRTISTPLGTSVYHSLTGELIHEVLSDEPKILLFGGKGGKGNSHFKTSTNKAPSFAQPGEIGKNLWVRLDLKVLADVGLVGFPNAGKSSLLKKITNASPKVADYPFTTLTPQLGVVQLDNYQTITIADIPGLIDGASQGHGLGIRFLIHLTRTKVLAFLLDISKSRLQEPEIAYQKLITEISAFSPDLLAKKKLVFLTKHDLIDPKINLSDTISHFEKQGVLCSPISSLSGEGIDIALGNLSNLLT